MKKTGWVTVIVLLTGYGCHQKTTDRQTKTPIKITHDSVDIAYTDTGRGDTTLFFVHGWGLNRNYWAAQIDYFRSKYRVVAIDLPGFGESGKGRTNWTPDEYAKDIATVIRQLDCTNTILIGHSMAQDIIVQAALDAPGRVVGLIGIDNFRDFGKPEDPKAKEEEANFFHQLRTHFSETAREGANLFFYGQSDSATRRRVTNDYVNTDSLIGTAVLEQAAMSPPGQLAERLRATKMTLHLINSDAMPTDTTGFGANGIPFDLVTIPATGHFPMIERPDEFNTLLKEVIERIH